MAFLMSAMLLNPGVCQPDNMLLLRTYEVAFGRAPDHAGANYWLNVASRQGIESAVVWMLDSPEGNKVTVEDVYRRALGREPDTAGLAYWQDVARRHSMGKVVYWFLTSKEHLHQYPLTEARHCSGADWKDLALGVAYRKSSLLHMVAIDLNLNDISMESGPEGVAAINAGWFSGSTPRGYTVMHGEILRFSPGFYGDNTAFFGDGWAGFIPYGDVTTAVTGHPTIRAGGYDYRNSFLVMDPVMAEQHHRSAVGWNQDGDIVYFVKTRQPMTAGRLQSLTGMPNLLMLDGGGSSLLTHRDRPLPEGHRDVPYWLSASAKG